MSAVDLDLATADAGRRDRLYDDGCASPALDRQEAAVLVPVKELPQGASHAGQDDTPLLIDLDSSLIRTDLLLETSISYAKGGPLHVFHMLAWAQEGRALLKRKLAEHAVVDLDLTPVNEHVVTLAAEAKRAGRKVYLVTAADEVLANRIAARFPFLDGVFASDGRINLKGANKAQSIRDLFPRGFDYVGDSKHDLPVWEHARRVIAVQPSNSLVRSLEKLGKPTTILPRPPLVPTLVKAARLHQWAKNALVFVPAILSGYIADGYTALMCALAFLALGLVAVGTYLINDLWDLEHDRRHRSKRHRPLASGAMPLHTALLAAPLTIATGFGIAATIGPAAVAVIAAYLALTLAYSLHLKRVAVLDAVVLATLFTLRLELGIAVSGAVTSPWLLVFSMLLFTSLSLAKRFTEIRHMAGKDTTEVWGRGYHITDGPFVLGLGLATATASIVIMVLYLTFDAFNRSLYGNPLWLWCLPIAVFLWVSRVWLVGHRGQLHDDPVVFALKDRQSLILGGTMAVIFLCAWIGVGKPL